MHTKFIFWIRRFISTINEYFITKYIEIAKKVFGKYMLCIQIGSGTTLSSNLRVSNFSNINTLKKRNV